MPATRPAVDGNDALQPAGAGRRRVRPLDDRCTERVRLIEFVWRARSGQQSVILADREFLH